MTSSNAANKPSDIEAQYRGETRVADGYQYWTTSQEDEEALDIREQVADGSYAATTVKKERRKIFEPGIAKRTGIRFASLILILALAALVYCGITYFQVTGATDSERAETATAAIVLGAAQYNGSPSYVLQERLDHAYNLYDDGTVPLIIVTGAAGQGDDITEGLVGYEHLRNRGVPEDDLAVIPEGVNTWEQMSASANQIDELSLGNVILVSDSYHTYRLLAIADELGIDATVSPSAIEPGTSDYLRETAAVSIGRITGYRRLSNFTENG